MSVGVVGLVVAVGVAGRAAGQEAGSTALGTARAKTRATQSVSALAATKRAADAEQKSDGVSPAVGTARRLRAAAYRVRRVG